MSHHQQELRRSMVRICWHMRGSISREEAWHLSPQERDDLRLFIDERIALVEKTGMPMI